VLRSFAPHKPLAPSLPLCSQQIAKSPLRVLTREGAPHCVRDLESVSAGSAKTIILLHPEKAKVGGPCLLL
jgi:hypothetical protein